jgi:two-component system sensor histidine kinase UhpB
MASFSTIVLLLSFAWAWRNVLDVAEERSARLVNVVALSMADRLAQERSDTDTACDILSGFDTRAKGTLYVTDGDDQIVCAPQDIVLAASTTDSRRYFRSSAPIPGTSWFVVLQEARSDIVMPTYSFLIAISALMIFGLFTSFWLLLIGFNRISWPLLAVTEQAMRVAEGREFIPPDVTGPAEVESLVAAFNHVVTQLRQQQNTLHDYATRVLYSQEEERNRISRDLHDETAQQLVGLMQRIDLCRLTVEDNPKMLDALDELAALTARTLAGVRRMSRALRPLILEDLGLVAALQATAEDLEGQLPNARVFCEVVGEEQRLLPEVELTAFRIVQEALTNVRKHADAADRVYVTVQFEPDGLHIRVEDNGCGFLLPARELQPDSDHLGLIGMQERAELLNGSLSILTRPGEGTQVVLQLPLDRPRSRKRVWSR